MAETLQKLRPDRDLQCYFLRPSAIAAMSNAAADRFTVSGSWRQQFDWAVIEWNRDNVFEHPTMRYLPEGDLSGLVLSYDETRTNCLALDSKWYPTVDWPWLRIWSEVGGTEVFQRVRLKDYATAVSPAYQPATATLTLTGSVGSGDYVGFAFLSEHYTHQCYGSDTPDSVIQALVDAVESFSPTATASRSGSTITISYVGVGQTLANSTEGANGNRIGVYTYYSGSGSLTWSSPAQLFAGGVSPTAWHVALNFSSLRDEFGNPVQANSVRKMRWTYAADVQDRPYERSDFQVQITNWTVSGTKPNYEVAGPGSRRVENSSSAIQYSGTWKQSPPGNFSGGTIHVTTQPGAHLFHSYTITQPHTAFLGTRRTLQPASVSISIDGGAPTPVNLSSPGEDYLVRIPIAVLPAGSHTVSITNSGASGAEFFFDFLEYAIASETLPSYPTDIKNTLATDWDTDHSIALPAERAAWMISSLGFHGRVNHYVGALWYYELLQTGSYASTTLTFSGTPQPNGTTTLSLGRDDQGPALATNLQHLNLIGDTAETVAKSFEFAINEGSSSMRAIAQGNELKLFSRAMSTDSNHFYARGNGDSNFTIVSSGPVFSGGADGKWLTDLGAPLKLNRAASDWAHAFFTALKGYGIDAVAAFSMELQNGDDSPAAGIAQRYPSGQAVWLNTPALQTNFSPATTSFFSAVYREMAAIMTNAGMTPYLQFGEVQWWYFPDDKSGLPFQDDYTKAQFRSRYGREISVIPNGKVLPSQYPAEAEFVPTLIGAFTDSIMSFVRQQYPRCRFEVLYPVDVNDTPFSQVMNYPTGSWTSSALDCLKTESFTYTYSRNLNLASKSVAFPATAGFPRQKRSHLIGIGDPISPWRKEQSLAIAENLESIVLFALDQFCLIGYPVRPQKGRRSSFQGS